jgi:DNA-binding LacI/PurR family transcriptional regulator
MERVSQATIAKKAGVSKVVVYTVLNNREGKGIYVGKKTRDKILRFADEMNYIAPKSAREFSTGKTDKIGLILHSLMPPFSNIVAEIQQVASKNKYEIIPILINSEEQEEKYLNTIRDGRVDAVIAMSFLDGSFERYRKYSDKPYNLKILKYGAPCEILPTVHFNDFQMGQLTANFLIKTGCQKLAFLSENINDKVDGFCHAVKQHKIPDPEIFIIPRGHLTSLPERTKKIIGEIFERKNIPDGFIVSNDFIAATLEFEIMKRGMRVPEDVAILASENTEICQFASPSLSSIDIDMPAIAKALIDKIICMIDGKDIPQWDTKIPVKIVERESTKKTRGSTDDAS